MNLFDSQEQFKFLCQQRIGLAWQRKRQASDFYYPCTSFWQSSSGGDANSVLKAARERVGWGQDGNQRWGNGVALLSCTETVTLILDNVSTVTQIIWIIGNGKYQSQQQLERKHRPRGGSQQSRLLSLRWWMGNSPQRYRCRTGNNSLVCRITSKSFAGISALPCRKAVPASSVTLPKRAAGARERERTEIPYFSAFIFFAIRWRTAEKHPRSLHHGECDGCSLQSTASWSGDGFSYLHTGGHGLRHFGEGVSDGSSTEKQSVGWQRQFLEQQFSKWEG